jgi:hypothetical protein
VGADHPSIAAALDNLAGAYVAEERYAEAEPLYRRSVAIRSKGILAGMDKLVGVYVANKKYDRAESVGKRALGIAEKLDPPDVVELGMVLERYEEVLRMLDRQEELAAISARLQAIREKLREERLRAEKANAAKEKKAEAAKEKN